MAENVTHPFKMMDINLIEVNPDQPRKLFEQEALVDLVTSIESHGILLPLLVQKLGKKYQVISGERRLHAARHLKVSEVPVIIREISPQTGFEIALIENLQRQSLTPLEEAMAYEKMMKEYELTQEKIAQTLGKNRSTIANLLRLLKLPEEMRTALHEGKMSAGHAKILLSLDNKIHQYRLFMLITLKDLSVQEARRIAESFTRKKKDDEEGAEKKQKDLVLSLWEEKILHTLGSRVNIKGTPQKGQMVIAYSSGKEFENLCAFFEDQSDDYSTY